MKPPNRVVLFALITFPNAYGRNNPAQNNPAKIPKTPTIGCATTRFVVLRSSLSCMPATQKHS